MNPQAAQNYLRTKVLTATAEQLQLMLFDGAIRFGQQARVALQQKNYEQSFQLISRTQEIINQLRAGLKHEIDPDLCGKLDSLYTYAYKRLIEATFQHNIESLDEAIKVLQYQRDTWAMLLEKLAKEKAGRAARKIDLPAPDPRMEATISMTG